MSDAPLRIRRGTRDDHEALAGIMYLAVHEGPSQYSEAQRQAWVPERRSGDRWLHRLAAQYVVIAERDEQPIGFMTLDGPDYLDFAYILPEAQGTGVFRPLLSEIEAEAARRGAREVRVHASLTAAPAFRACGFGDAKPETVTVRGVDLPRYSMRKTL